MVGSGHGVGNAAHGGIVNHLPQRRHAILGNVLIQVEGPPKTSLESTKRTSPWNHVDSGKMTRRVLTRPRDRTTDALDKGWPQVVQEND